MKRPGNRAWFGWLMQRVTAIYLTLFLFAHVVRLAMVADVSVVSLVGMVQTSFLWWAAYLLFVPNMVFHALYGLYNVFLDYQPPAGIVKISVILLWLTGLGTVFLGWVTLFRL